MAQTSRRHENNDRKNIYIENQDCNPVKNRGCLIQTKDRVFTSNLNTNEDIYAKKISVHFDLFT